MLVVPPARAVQSVSTVEYLLRPIWSRSTATVSTTIAAEITRMRMDGDLELHRRRGRNLGCRGAAVAGIAVAGAKFCGFFLPLGRH